MDIVSDLANDGVKLNIPRSLRYHKLQRSRNALRSDVPAVVSVFAGRIADTGVDLSQPCWQQRLCCAGYRKPNYSGASVREVLIFFPGRAMRYAYSKQYHMIYWQKRGKC